MNHAIDNESYRMGRRWTTIQAAASLSLAVVLAAGWAPTAKLAGPQGLSAMLTAAGITWLITGLSFLPALWFIGTEPKRFAQSVLAASALRFVLVLLATLPIILLRTLPVVPFLIWIAISYLSILAADTAVILYFFTAKRN